MHEDANLVLTGNHWLRDRRCQYQSRFQIELFDFQSLVIPYKFHTPLITSLWLQDNYLDERKVRQSQMQHRQHVGQIEY